MLCMIDRLSERLLMTVSGSRLSERLLMTVSGMDMHNAVYDRPTQ